MQILRNLGQCFGEEKIRMTSRLQYHPDFGKHYSFGIIVFTLHRVSCFAPQ